MRSVTKHLATLCLGAGVLAGTAAHGALIMPTGDGGTFVAYRYDATGRTFVAANAFAQGTSFSLAPGQPLSGGQLITVNSAETSRLTTRSIGELGGNYWIGLNDIANESGVPVASARNRGLAQMGTTGWAHPSGVPHVYTNWNGGEPNDAGGEDAIEALGNGLWNDLPANNGSFLRASIIEYRSTLSDPTKLDGFKIVQAKAYNNIQNMTIAESVINGQIPSVQTSQAVSTMNFQENGNDGLHFGGGLQVPGIVGDQSNYVSRTTADLNVNQAGLYTFGFASDDGGKIVVDGKTVIEFYGNRGNSDSIAAPIQLSAGAHSIEFVWYEQGGGASGEAFYGQGAIGQFNVGGTMVLVGNNSQGIDASNMQTTTYHVQIPNTGDINNINAALAMYTGATRATISEYHSSVVNFRDTGGAGNFGGDDPFPFLEGTDADDFAIIATGFLDVREPGFYQFGSNTDDGSAMRIDGFNYLVDDVLSGPHNVVGPLIFLDSGLHTFEYLFFERGGGAEAEVFQVIDGRNVLLGDVANGALRVTQDNSIPEPATALLGVMGAGLLALRRRLAA